MFNTNHRPLGTVAGWLSCAALCLLGTAAQAHLMPAGHGTINVVGDKAYMVLSVPVEAFSSVAACRDGLLTPGELAANHAALQQQVRTDLQLKSNSADALEFKQVMFDLPAGHGHAGDAGEDLVVMVVAQLGGAPSGLSLASSMWGAKGDPLKVRATVSEKGRDVRREVLRMSPARPRAVFFASAKSAAGR